MVLNYDGGKSLNRGIANGRQPKVIYGDTDSVFIKWLDDKNGKTFRR